MSESGINYSDCLVNRCKWKKKFRELEPKFEKMKTDHDKAVVEMENFAKIVKEGKTDASQVVKKMIVEKVELRNKKEILEKETEKLEKDKEVLQIELKEVQKRLKEKTEQVYEIKTQYELDDEIVEKQAEIKKLSHEVEKKLLEKNRLENLNEKIKRLLKKGEEDYNHVVDNYNKEVDRLKGKKKEVKQLDKLLTKVRKESRLAKLFVKKKKVKIGKRWIRKKRGKKKK